MMVLLEDKQPDAEDAPIRTPYDTNIVLTFPTEFETLLRRLKAGGIQVEKTLPDINGGNYLGKMLGYAANQFAQAIQVLNLDGTISLPLIKQQNRRIYIMPRHLANDNNFSKSGGVDMGSLLLAASHGYPEATFVNSIYVADKAADVTSEGQLVIGASEKCMIYGLNFFEGEAPQGLKIVKLHGFDQRYRVLVAEVANRLTINVTMNDALPRVYFVEGVKMLDIGSGLKSLEAITHLYERLHK